LIPLFATFEEGEVEARMQIGGLRIDERFQEEKIGG
jgi:hypothetical protein